MATFANSSEGGTGGAALTFGGEPSGSIRFGARREPPETAIQFTREIWVDKIEPYQTMVYFTDKGTWEHYDASPCEHGLDVPAGEWAEAGIPFQCRHDRPIRRKAGGAFYVDDMPLG